MPSVTELDSNAHICFARGCNEIVTGRYHCARHEAIAAKRRTIIARRATERAAERKREKP